MYREKSHNSIKEGHGMSSSTMNTRALKIAGLLTGVYFVIELIVGLWTGSISVISDAFHTFSAVGGVLIALIAGQFAMRPSTKNYTFGLIRAEIVGALFNGLFLFAMALLVFWMGIMRLLSPIELSVGPMLLVAFGGLATEVISLKLMWKGQKENLNMKGAFWHILQTFVGSLIVIVSALVIYFTGFLAIDPILGMGFGAVLFWASWKITREAIDILLDSVPKELDLGMLEKTIKEMSGIKDVHHLHARSLAAGKNIVSAHILVDKTSDHAKIQKQLFKLVHARFPVYFSTFQLEDRCFEKSEAKEIDISYVHPKS